MTAEIAIINRQALVLAADSAVTVGRERVWKRGNKIFTLGPMNDMAVMIHQMDEFVGFPWELVIKTFRNERCVRAYNTVRECAASLMDFLDDPRFKPDRQTTIAQLETFVQEFEWLKKDLPARSKQKWASLNDKCAQRLAALQLIERIDKAPSKAKFLAEYKDAMFPLIAATFEDVPAKLSQSLIDICYEIWTRRLDCGYYTGVVIAGFGKREMFGSLCHYFVDGKDSLFVRKWHLRTCDLNIDDGHEKATVLAFGQSDIAQIFMGGVDNRFQIFVRRALKKVLQEKSERIVKEFVHDPKQRTAEAAKQRDDNKAILKTLRERIEGFQYNSVAKKILDVVSSLPKEEMAEMAQAIVEVTSLRRKIDSSLETVGGPADVVVISKSDGVIWIRRKHYFDIEKNRDFFYRKYGSRKGADDATTARARSSPHRE